MILENEHFQPFLLLDPRLQGIGLALAILLLTTLGQRLLRLLRWRPRQARPWRMRVAQPNPQIVSSTSVTSPFAQLEAIAAVDFEVTPLLNKEEARLLPMIESAVRAYGSGHRVMAQSSLGESIRPKDNAATETVRKAAYASINSKRLDFAVFDRFGRLVAAIEYQGTGHHQKDAFLRDAVKREAVRKAGVPFLEFDITTAQDEVERKLRDILQPRVMHNAQRG